MPHNHSWNKMKKTALVSGFNKSCCRLHDLACCVIIVVCQETIHTNIYTPTVVWSIIIWNFLLLGGTNQLQPKGPKQREAYHQQKQFLPVPLLFSSENHLLKDEIPDQNSLLQPLTISTYWHCSELTPGEKIDQINKQWGEMLFSQGFK